MLTNSVIVLTGGVEEQTFGDILSSILAAIGSLFEALLEQVKLLAYLCSPVEIPYISGTPTEISVWKAQNPIIGKYLISRSTEGIRTLYFPANPLLFIFLCLCIIGLGVTIFRRLANVN